MCYLARVLSAFFVIFWFATLVVAAPSDSPPKANDANH